MLFPPKAVERAMQIKEVLLRAMNKEYSWLRAAEIMGITPRGLRRLRERMERFGYQGLVDMRRGRPSPRRVAEVERILELYRERYAGFNGRHFWQIVRRGHGVKPSYSCVKQMLQGAGLVKKGRARGRHRRRRERKACFGEMLHLDGSLHRWLKLTGEDRQMLIQVGQALHRLGIEHIPSYSPQARGRSERMNRTLQDRLVNDLRAADRSLVNNTISVERRPFTKKEYLCALRQSCRR
jgi:transposase